MRCLKRNEQTFYYALYLRTEKVLDANGYQIGAHAVYGNPVKARANVSASQGTNVYAAQGASITEQYGVESKYKRVLVLENRDTPLNEESVLWVDTTPQLDENGAVVLNADGSMVTPPDYIVSSIQRGLPIFGNAVVTVARADVI